MTSLRALQSKGLGGYLRAVRATSRRHLRGIPRDSAVVPLWHESLLVGLPLAAGRRNVAVYVLDDVVTPSIKATIRDLGLELIRARRDNGYGAPAVRDFVRTPGSLVLVTLDGPDGPRRVCRDGVARLARIAKVPLCPALLTADRAHTLATWDQCVVPEPFGTLSGTLLPPIDAGGSPRLAAAAVDAALAAASAGGRAPSSSNWVGAAARFWVEACVSPLRFGRLELGADAQSADTAPIASTR